MCRFVFVQANLNVVRYSVSADLNYILLTHSVDMVNDVLHVTLL